MAESAALLVDEVLPAVPIRQWVLSFPFPLRFLFASRPKIMGKVLGIVYRVLATHLIHKAGFTHATASTGAVTLIQRFGGALNLNVHFHMLLLDGVYADSPAGPRFRWVKAPSSAELRQLSHTIAHRVSRFLERLCRYITRPAVSEKRLSITAPGQVRYSLKTPWNEGTTPVLGSVRLPLTTLIFLHACSACMLFCEMAVNRLGCRWETTGTLATTTRITP
jgi:hypothetical protein